MNFFLYGWLILSLFFGQEDFCSFWQTTEPHQEWRQETKANGLPGLCRLWWTAAEEHESAPSPGRDECRGQLHRLPRLPLNRLSARLGWSVCGKYLHAVSGRILEPRKRTQWEILRNPSVTVWPCRSCRQTRLWDLSVLLFAENSRQLDQELLGVLPDFAMLTLHYCNLHI